MASGLGPHNRKKEGANLENLNDGATSVFRYSTTSHCQILLVILVFIRMYSI